MRNCSKLTVVVGNGYDNSHGSKFPLEKGD
jgi:hypothetical protein